MKPNKQSETILRFAQSNIVQTENVYANEMKSLFRSNRSTSPILGVLTICQNKLIGTTVE